MKIVYLEDNQLDAELVRRYVESTNHELSIVTKPDEIDDSHPVDLYLIDIIIDNQHSGLDFIKHLRNTGFQQQIIAVTALSSEQEMENCRDAGCNAVLVKPYSINHLAEVIENLS